LKNLFKKIWLSRPHKCECCHQDLGEIPSAYFFSHILSKGAYPSYKKLEENILLICQDCHFKWEFGNRNSIKFSLKKRLYELLKQAYNK